MYMSYRLLVGKRFFYVQFQRTSEPEPDEWNTYSNGIFLDRLAAEAFLAKKTAGKYPGAQYFRDEDYNPHAQRSSHEKPKS